MFWKRISILWERIILKNKTKKNIFIIVIILAMLTCSYIVVSIVSRAQWHKGLYLFENDIQIYADDTNVEFDIGAIVVGDDILETIKNKNTRCYLKNGENSTEVKMSVVGIVKENHYYNVELTISCSIPEGHYLFDDLIIDGLGEINAWRASGNIEITVEPKARETQIEKTLSVWRSDETCEFIYTISNPTNDDIIISTMNWNIQDSNLLLINNEDIGNDDIDLMSAKKFSFPITLSANKEAHLYYSIPINERLSNTYLYLRPSVDYKESGSDEINKLYFKFNSNPPTIQKSANDVLEYINERELGE